MAGKHSTIALTDVLPGPECTIAVDIIGLLARLWVVFNIQVLPSDVGDAMGGADAHWGLFVQQCVLRNLGPERCALLKLYLTQEHQDRASKGPAADATAAKAAKQRAMSLGLAAAAALNTHGHTTAPCVVPGELHDAMAAAAEAGGADLVVSTCPDHALLFGAAWFPLAHPSITSVWVPEHLDLVRSAAHLPVTLPPLSMSCFAPPTDLPPAELEALKATLQEAFRGVAEYNEPAWECIITALEEATLSALEDALDESLRPALEDGPSSCKGGVAVHAHAVLREALAACAPALPPRALTASLATLTEVLGPPQHVAPAGAAAPGKGAVMPRGLEGLMAGMHVVRDDGEGTVGAVGAAAAVGQGTSTGTSRSARRKAARKAKKAKMGGK